MIGAAALAFAFGASCGTAQHATTSGGMSGTTTETIDGGAGGTADAGGGGGAGGGQPPAFCTGCSLDPLCKPFVSTEIAEASGLATSAAHAGVVYTHNDSGDVPRFFASNCAGDDLGTYNLTGAEAIDWEDMAIGPCDRKRCLFFADIGDNRLARAEYAIYRTDEPAAVSAGAHDVTWTKLAFTYPDGAHDAETLLAHPTTGDLFIVTKVKETGAGGVYAFPPGWGRGPVVLTKIGDVTPPTGSARITAGDMHPTGRGILLRTYTHLWFYAASPGQSVAEILGAAPCEVPVQLELQGEAVAFRADGSGYITVSEHVGQALHGATCK